MQQADDIEALRATMQTTGWQVFERVLTERGRQFTKMALGFAANRPKPYDQASDDFLKGMVHQMQWDLEGLKGEIAAYEVNLRRDELARQTNGEPVRQ